MRGLNPFPESAPEHRENWRVMNDVLDEIYFSPTFHAGDGRTDGGAVFDSNVVPGVTTVEFPAAGSPAWRTDRGRLARWQNGAIRLTVLYTATVGGKNGFVLEAATREAGAGDVLPTADILNASFVLPGPPVANTLTALVYVSPAVAINGAKAVLDFRLTRLKGDARDVNVNSLHIYEARWEVLPL